MRESTFTWRSRQLHRNWLARAIGARVPKETYIDLVTDDHAFLVLPAHPTDTTHVELQASKLTDFTTRYEDKKPVLAAVTYALAQPVRSIEQLNAHCFSKIECVLIPFDDLEGHTGVERTRKYRYIRIDPEQFTVGAVTYNRQGKLIWVRPGSALDELFQEQTKPTDKKEAVYSTVDWERVAKRLMV